MNQPDRITKFLSKLVWDNFFILQNIFLKIWKILQITMQNLCQLSLSEDFAKNFTVNCNCW